MKWSRVLDAALRHLVAYNSGERIDGESGLSHLAHVATNICFLIEYEKEGLGVDDLWRGTTNDAK